MTHWQEEKVRVEGVSPSRRVALLTFDPVGPRISGTAIRAIELTRAIAEAGHEATLFTPALESGGPTNSFPIRKFNLTNTRRTLLPFLAHVEVIVLPFYALARIPALAACSKPLVFDIYDPFLFELLAPDTSRPLNEIRQEVNAYCSVMKHVLRRGDFFLCASERQRDMWIGALASNGRLIPSYHGDPQFLHLIDVVPIGIPDQPPQNVPDGVPSLRGVLASISQRDTVIVSGGTLWDWQDPVTAVRAMGRVALRRRDIHLVFFVGTLSDVQQRPSVAATSALALARELGIFERQVHFIDRWIPYAEWGRYLSECDAGITTHKANLESRYAFRTRILDYLWAGLPVISTEGDVLAELIAKHNIGIVVPPGDDGALAAVFERIADDHYFRDTCRSHITAIRPSLAARVAAEPLVRFCENPRFGDRAAGGAAGARELLSAAWHVLCVEGPREAALRVFQRAFLRIWCA